MNELTDIQKLFADLKTIDDAHQAEELETKSAFNIFTILRKQHEEVGLHSRFLAELLDPNASHKMTIFQRLFIEKVINPAISEQSWDRKPIDTDTLFSCGYEIKMGNYGRVDLILRSRKQVIVIENKIYAEDQKNQLERYFNACRHAGYAEENIYIIYLNRFGEDIGRGKGNLADNEFAHITYKEHIADWLDACVKQAKAFPHIEQTIIQYRTVVGRITGDTGSAKMKQQHIELLSQGDNFKLAYQLSQSFEAFQIQLQNQIWDGLIKSFKDKGYGFSFCYNYLQPAEQTIAVKSYFKAKKSKEHNRYGLQLLLGHFKNYDVHCYLELNEHMYFSITMSQDGKRTKYPKESEVLCEKIKTLSSEWQYLSKPWNLPGQLYPNESVNFKKPNDNFHLLTNDSYRKEWIEQFSAQIIQFIEDVKSLGMIETV